MHEYLFKGICLRSEELFAGIALGKLQREHHLQECVVKKKNISIPPHRRDFFEDSCPTPLESQWTIIICFEHVNLRLQVPDNKRTTEHT